MITWTSLIIVLIVFIILWWAGTRKYEFNLEKAIAKEEERQKKLSQKSSKKSIFKNGLFWFSLFSFVGLVLLFF